MNQKVYYDILVYLFTEVVNLMNLMKFNCQNSSENLQNAPILLHAAHRMTRLIGVDLSWKALL